MDRVTINPATVVFHGYNSDYTTYILYTNS